MSDKVLLLVHGNPCEDKLSVVLIAKKRDLENLEVIFSKPFLVDDVSIAGEHLDKIGNRLAIWFSPNNGWNSVIEVNDCCFTLYDEEGSHTDTIGVGSGLVMEVNVADSHKGLIGESAFIIDEAIKTNLSDEISRRTVVGWLTGGAQ